MKTTGRPSPILLAALFILLLAAAASSGEAQNIYRTNPQTPSPKAQIQIPPGWTMYRGQSGLVVFHPQGWRVQEHGGGAFCAFLPGPGGGATAVVYVQPLEKIEGKSSGIVQGLDRIAPQLFPEVRVAGLRAVSANPDVAIGEISYSPRGQAFQGVAMCFKQNQQGVLYVIASTRPTYAQAEPVMKQILGRFFYSGAGQGGQ